MSKLVIANWKMNLSLNQAIALCDEYKKSDQLIVAPPACYLALLHDQFPLLRLSAQNISYIDAEEGAYTGELSAKLLASCGVKYTILGHSERRKYFDENNMQIKKSVENAHRAAIVPILCVGEAMQEGDVQHKVEFLMQQISSVIDSATISPIIIAYEPVWAVGSGATPSIDQLRQIFAALRNALVNTYPDLAKNIQLVYGGSVNSENSAAILSITHIDGVLVGGVSLKAEELNKIILQAEAL